MFKITNNKTINEDINHVLQNNLELIRNKSIKNVLITWANWLLPSYLLYFLVGMNQMNNEKTNIYVIIRNNSDKIDKILDKKNIHILSTDVKKTIQSDIEFDMIIHAASDASPTKYMKNRIETINTNVLWLYNILSLNFSKLKSFLYFSSWEIYGEVEDIEIPTKETYIPKTDHLKERSVYEETKRFCETLSMNYFYEKKIPLKIIRPFHTFWPWINFDDGRVFWDFIKAAYLKEDIVINSDWTAIRTFCYLADALDMFVKVLFSEKNGEVYNIGNPKNEISIKELAKIVCEIVDNKITYNILWEENSKAPSRSCPDISKWIKELWFKPIYNLSETFKRTLDSFYS